MCSVLFTVEKHLVLSGDFLKYFFTFKNLLYYSYCYFIYFYVLVVLHRIWDLSSLTINQTCSRCIGSAES